VRRLFSIVAVIDIVLAMPVLLVACYDGIDVPRCTILSDCPPDLGYTACEDGYCFKSGRCDHAQPVPGDGCCPPAEADRTGDTDCLSHDLDVGARPVSRPAADDDGALFVTGLGQDPSGRTSIVLRRLDPGGFLSLPVFVGPGNAVLPPTVSRGRSVMVAWADGVTIYQSRTLAPLATVPGSTPAGGLVCTDGRTGGRAIAGWPTVDGRVVLYDEDRDVALTLDVGPDPGARSEVLPPVVSGLGRRMLVLWRSGLLVSLEVANSPLGPVALKTMDGPVPVGPIEVDGTIYVVDGANRLMALVEDERRFETRWIMELGGLPVGGLLAAPDGVIVVALSDGNVLRIRDLGDRGVVVSSDGFGQDLSDRWPVLCESGRVSALSASGRKILSLVRIDEPGSLRFEPGLHFEVPVEASSDPVLFGSRLLFGTASGRLTGWEIPDRLAAGRFPQAGAGVGNTGRTVPRQDE
jgi:hypothetical protein